MKKPQLLVLVAVWEFLCAFGILIGIGGVSSYFFFTVPGVWWDGMMGGWGMWDLPRIGNFAIIVMGFVLLIMVAYFVLSLMGGIGLLKGREWGRIVSIVHAALSLFWIPIGTVVGILILIYLTKTEVQEYFIG